MGRPREFDTDQAVQTAAELFWRKGYEGASLSELTKAIGVSAPSFYYAFGSKEKLFEKALEAYRAGHLGFVEDAMRQTAARDVAEQFLYGYADALTDPRHPPGCLALNCSLPVNDGDAVRSSLMKWRVQRKAALRDRFETARMTGDLPAHADAEGLASYVMVVAWGLAVDAQTGASRDALRSTVRIALTAWPC